MQKTGYTKLQIALHWATAFLIGANWFVSEGMGDALDAKLNGEAVVGLTPLWHVWAGTLLLVLVMVRIVTRLAFGAPELTEANPWVARAAGLGHLVLYGLMLAVPALGAITWFGGVDATGDLHVLLMDVLMVVILGHAAMAIFHHYVLKDGLLKRMIRAA